MLTLESAKVNQTYIVEELHAEGDLKRHLTDLGMKKKAKVALIVLNRDSGIVSFSHSRVALDRSILRLISISEIEEDTENWQVLNDLKVGEMGRVIAIHGTGAIKRRLMDMGITRGTEIYIRKTAPLGDPIEINLRGYELTLRKSEAELVLVTPLNEEKEHEK
ncbi:ferrous iron transport protein A [Pilibacter termitis]|uniref:Ferrous iron transport protein A n=1 Tax=Pilibacter termitis TaxID=263852 RepID=A0A1T4K7K3_9ENTE|nr:ferrous iron transport protein A [Pilibacter termitis]SJZ38386.1 ferrous iron transport protein A [Pilibacter termitis]